jgi:hypothetical protein
VVFAPEKNSFANVADRTVNGCEGEATGSEKLAGGAFELYYRVGASYQTIIAEGGHLLGVAADMYPRFLVNALLGVQWRGGLSLGLGGTYVSKVRREEFDVRSGLPARCLLDVSLGVDDFLLKGIHLGLVVQNVVGSRYADPLSSYLGVRKDYPRGKRQVMLSIGFSQASP